MKKKLSEIFKGNAGSYFSPVDYSSKENAKKLEDLKKLQKDILANSKPSQEALDKIIIRHSR